MTVQNMQGGTEREIERFGLIVLHGSSRITQLGKDILCMLIEQGHNIQALFGSWGDTCVSFQVLYDHHWELMSQEMDQWCKTWWLKELGGQLCGKNTFEHTWTHAIIARFKPKVTKLI